MLVFFIDPYTEDDAGADEGSPLCPPVPEDNGREDVKLGYVELGELEKTRGVLGAPDSELTLV